MSRHKGHSGADVAILLMLRVHTSKLSDHGQATKLAIRPMGELIVRREQDSGKDQDQLWLPRNRFPLTLMSQLKNMLHVKGLFRS